MRFETTGVATTTSGLLIVNPIIVVDFKLKNELMLASIYAYANVDEEINSGKVLKLRIDSKREVLDRVTESISNIKSCEADESIKDTLERLAKEFLSNQLNITIN